MDDRALVEATLRGDHDAFARLVRKYQEPLVASACHLIRQRDDAEDLAQETFVEAYKQLHTLREPDKFAGWLFTILRNKCLRYLKRRRHDVPLEECGETPAAPPSADESELADALQRLPLQDREVLAARYLQGLAYDEVAGALGIGITAARMRCSRARERLRHLMLEADEESTRLLMQRAIGVILIGGVSATFTSRVVQEVNTMQVTMTPHAAAHGGAGQSYWPQWMAHLGGRRIAAGVIVLLVLAGMGVTWYTLNKQPGGRGMGSAIIALLAGNSIKSDEIDAIGMQQALHGVKTIHLAGEEEGMIRDVAIPMAEHREKWIRCEPFAEYEEVTPVKPDIPQNHHYIFAGNTERAYWYFPERGNQARIVNGLHADFTDAWWLAPRNFKIIGHDEVEGRKLILLDAVLPAQPDAHYELAVDQATKRAYRLRMFTNGPDGKPVESTKLRIEYNQTAPAGVFEWHPPAGATVVDKRKKGTPVGGG